MMFLSVGASKCNRATQIAVCNQVHDYTMKPLPSGQYSSNFDICIVRCTDPNTYDALELSNCPEKYPDAKAGEYERVMPKEACNNVMGFYMKNIPVDIIPNIKALNGIKQDYCN